MSEAPALENVLLPKSLLSAPDKLGGEDSGDCLFGNLIFQDRRVLGLSQPTSRDPYHLLMPPLVECHIHLDKCFTFSRLTYGGGDLSAAIKEQAKDRESWTPQDIRDRATKALARLKASGCGKLRTHVDWSHGDMATTPPMAWHVLTEIAEERRNEIEIQVAPLVAVNDLADAQKAEIIAQICAHKSKVLGAFVLGQAGQQRGIENAFAMAQKYGLALDFHVDETMDPSFNGLEIIADAALKFQISRPVLCGHACNLATKTANDRARIMDKLARAGIALVVLPTTNLYLQGRCSADPKLRGLAPLHALQSAGVSVAVGTDNVEDAFFPLGQFDPRRTLELAISVAHLDPPFGAHLPMITMNAEQALDFAPSWIDRANVEDLFVYDSLSVADFLTSSRAPMSLCEKIRGGKG